jgi:hypothetical protein
VPSELSKRVVERLNELVDEETKRKFGELNIVTEVSEMATGSISVKFQPLSAYSPLAVDTGRSSGHMMDDLVNRLVNEDEAGPKPLK